MSDNITPKIIYDIDAKNVIFNIEGSWKEFLEENTTSDLNTTNVIGSSLFTFIIGEDMRLLYKDMLSFVRSRQREISFPFHCDSPGIIRRMRMDMTPLANNAVRFCTSPLEIKPRPKHIWYKYVAFGMSKHYFCCSICNKIFCENEWLSLDMALSQAKMLDCDKPLAFYGALCPDCKSGITSIEKDLHNILES